MSLSTIISEALSSAGLVSNAVKKFNQGFVWGTCDLAGLADSQTGALSLSGPVQLLGSAVGTSGAGLGFGDGFRLTLAETNMKQAGTINSTRALIVRGYGVNVTAFPQYGDSMGGGPARTGWPPLTLERIATNITLSYERGTRDRYEAGPLMFNTAGEFGATAVAASTTVNNSELLSAKTGAGSMLHFDHPDAWLVIGPNGSLDFSISQQRGPIYLTSTGFEAQDPDEVMKSARLSVVLSVYDIEGVKN